MFRKGPLLFFVLLLALIFSACTADGSEENKSLEGSWSYPNLTVSVPDGYGIQVEDIQLSTPEGNVITGDFIAGSMLNVGDRWEVIFTQQGDHSGRINIVVSVLGVPSLEAITVQ